MIIKQHYFLIALFFFTKIIFAQIPIDYYRSANNLSDGDLKNELNQIIDDHQEFSYTSTSTDVWDILKETDRDPNNSENVILIYSGISVKADQEYNSGNGWTREHVWAKSRGDFGTSKGAGTDVHALRPLDNRTNSERSNRSFDNCSSCEQVIDKWNNNTGSKKDFENWTFEPRDEVKGDVARMLFYMVVRYEGAGNEPNLEPTEIVLPQDDKLPVHGVWSTLMEWNRIDPVDEFEKNRNDIIYYTFQNNRNPFIDYPELAEHLWGDKIGDNWIEDHTLSSNSYTPEAIRIYPNPAIDIINIKGISVHSEITIFDALGRKVLASKINKHYTSVDVSELKGMYLLTIQNDKEMLTKKILIK